MFPAIIDASSYLADGTKGFIVNNKLTNSAGGDINGDGKKDLILGNSVIYGQNSTTFFPASIDTATYLADGTKGFVTAPASMGSSVSNAGDINGDGKIDIIMGDPSSNKAYVIYGQNNTTFFPASINTAMYLADGTKGFTISGGSRTGFCVSNAGDINGDGRIDLVVGAPVSNQAYVIYGKNSTTPFPSAVNVGSAGNYLADGSRGFTINGPSGSFTGVFITNAGDINGDNITDFAIGRIGSGARIYVIYGQNSTNPFPANIDPDSYLADGTKGFIISIAGASVSNAGDINGDGKVDIVVGAGTGYQVYVIYGQNATNPFPANIDPVSYLADGAKGFTVNLTPNLSTGVMTAPFPNMSVNNKGDINGDGKIDLVIGATANSQAFVIYGQNSTNPFPASIDATAYLADGCKGFVVNAGARIGTHSGYYVSNDGDINGDNITDLVIGPSSVSTAYVIFGRSASSPLSSELLSCLPSSSPSTSKSLSFSPSPFQSPSASLSSSPSALVSPSASISPSPSESPSPSPSLSPSASISQEDLSSLGALTALTSQTAGNNQLLSSSAGETTAYNSQFWTTTQSLGTPTGTAGGITTTTGTTGILTGTQTITCQEILSTPSVSLSKTLISPIESLKSKKNPLKTTKGKELKVRAISERKEDKAQDIKVVIKDGKVVSATGEQISNELIGKIVKKVNKKGKTNFKVQLVKKDSTTGEKTILQQYQCIKEAVAAASPSVSGTPLCRKIIQIKKYDPAVKKYKLIDIKEVEGGSITVDPKGKNVIESKNLKDGGVKVLIQKRNGKRKLIKDFACRQVVKINPPVGKVKGKVKRFDLNLLKARNVEGTDSRRNIRSADSSMANAPESLWMKPFSLGADVLNSGGQSIWGNIGIEQTAGNNRWNDGSLIHAAQLPLAQAGMHLMQQGYNCIADWFQGKGSDEGIQIQELLPREQVSGFLQDYNKVSQELESVIQQLEAEDTVSSSMLSWLKESIVEHRTQGQQLVQQSMVDQTNVKSYFENIQVVAKDVTEFVEELGLDSASSMLPYIQSRLLSVNQELVNLSRNPAVVSKDQTTLRATVKAQIQTNTLQQQPLNLIQPPTAINASTQLTADVMGLLV
jgi:hypothetical protein